jgi:4-amino-4-deoxychorismate lyase
MTLARKELWNIHTPVGLGKLLIVPQEFSTGFVKCNIHYGPDIEQVRFSKYEKRIIRSLKMVDGSGIDYHLKFSDRSALDSLYALRGNCDEVIIVIDGFVTDTSMANLIFSDRLHWITPVNPLLKGTCRNRMVAGGGIIEKEIPVADLYRYAGCKLINAMRDPDEEILIPSSEII